VASGSMIRSLAHRNFRLFFIAQVISLCGSWMQQIAMSWLVYQLTNSSFLLGTTLFLSQIPCLIVSPFVGPLTDRLDRRRILYVTQALAMGQAIVLAGLALAGVVTVWEIMGLSLFLGLTIAFDMPARQAFLSEMIDDPGDLPNAIAMNATMFNSARLIGPALAGLLLAQTSAGVCFMLNAASFIPVFFSLMAMHLPPRILQNAGRTLRAGMDEGVHYAWHFPPLRNILLLLCLGSITGSAASVFLPEYTVTFLHGDAHLLGWLASAMGAGAVLAALFLASRRTVVGHGLWIGGGLGIMGLGLLAMPFMSQAWTALAVLVVVGFGLVIHIAGGNTIIQTIADEDKRGRIMGFYTMAIVGVAPLGNLLNGFLGSHIGLTSTFVAMGVLAIAGSIAFLLWIPRLQEYVRPIYIRLKILPPVA